MEGGGADQLPHGTLYLSIQMYNIKHTLVH